MEELSRTKKKHGAENLQKLGESLVELPEIEIHRMDIPQKLKDAVLFAQTTKKHGARRRQLQYIGSLMRKLDPTPIEEALEQISRGRAVAVNRFKEMEQWRDAFINEESSSPANAMEDFMEQYPETDRQRLGQLIRNARKSPPRQQASHGVDSTAKMPKSARTLFQYIRQVVEDHHDS